MTTDSTDSSITSPRIVDLRLAALVVVALVVRLAWVLNLPSNPASLARLPDQVEYLELGQNLLRGAGLKFVDPRFAEDVWAFRMPGYPLFVALCQGEPRIVRIAQALLDAGSVLAVYLLARRWIERSASLLAAALVAFNPFLVYFCGLLLSETLFTAMLIWGMVLLVVPRRPLWWCAGALLLAMSILVRPSAIGLPVVLGVAGAFVNRETQQPYDRKWSPPVASLMLFMTILVLLPWAWRNNRALGNWIWTTTNSGFTLYDGLNPDAIGASDQTFVRRMPQLQSLDEVGRSRYLGELAQRFARENPLQAIKLAGLKIARMWSPIPLSNEYGRDLKLIMVSLVYMIPLYLLILRGLWGGNAPKAAKLYLLAPAVYFTMVHAISVGSLRYRVPADVPISIVAAAGAAVLFKRKVKPVVETDMTKSQ